MPLTRKELEELLLTVGRTCDREIDCDTCLSRIAEFAECELSGKSIPESLTRVEQHLSVCAECREEYEVLLRALKEMS